MSPGGGVAKERNVVIKSDKTIYQLIEQRLREATSPMTCSDLMETYDDLREEAIEEFGGKTRDSRVAANKLSDLLGFMWRRGVLTRYPAPRTSTSFARYAYSIATQPEKEPSVIPPPVKLKSKSLVGIVEHDDCVEIEFDKFVIFVKTKK